MKSSFSGSLLLLVAVTTFSSAPFLQAKQNTRAKHPPQQQQSGDVPASNFAHQTIIVEDLAADVHSDSGTITITAKITNVSMALIRGYATVHLLSAEGKRILSYEEEINGGEAFPHGATMDVEVTAKVGDVGKIASITVDFTQI